MILPGVVTQQTLSNVTPQTWDNVLSAVAYRINYGLDFIVEIEFDATSVDVIDESGFSMTGGGISATPNPGDFTITGADVINTTTLRLFVTGPILPYGPVELIYDSNAGNLEIDNVAAGGNTGLSLTQHIDNFYYDLVNTTVAGMTTEQFVYNSAIAYTNRGETPMRYAELAFALNNGPAVETYSIVQSIAHDGFNTVMETSNVGGLVEWLDDWHKRVALSPVLLNQGDNDVYYYGDSENGGGAISDYPETAPEFTDPPSLIVAANANGLSSYQNTTLLHAYTGLGGKLKIIGTPDFQILDSDSNPVAINSVVFLDDYHVEIRHDAVPTTNYTLIYTNVADSGSGTLNTGVAGKVPYESTTLLIER